MNSQLCEQSALHSSSFIFFPSSYHLLQLSRIIYRIRPRLHLSSNRSSGRIERINRQPTDWRLNWSREPPYLTVLTLHRMTYLCIDYVAFNNNTAIVERRKSRTGKRVQKLSTASTSSSFIIHSFFLYYFAPASVVRTNCPVPLQP